MWALISELTNVSMGSKQATPQVPELAYSHALEEGARGLSSDSFSPENFEDVHAHTRELRGMILPSRQVKRK